MQNSQQVGRIQKGWEITKSSWLVLKLDKELMGLPALSLLVSFVALLAFAAAAFTYFIYQSTGGINPVGHTFTFATDKVPTWISGIFLISIYFVMTLITNLFGAAVIYGATERFNGGDPTVSSSMNGAMRKLRPLALFSLMMSTIGLLFQALEDRVPFAGQIAVWLMNAAWSVANVFAVPVIVLSDRQVGPLEATKESVKIIRQVWGESVVADIGISVIAVLSMGAYLFASGAVFFGLSFFTQDPAVLIATTVAAFFGLIVLATIFTTLASIAKAALYHYATTGKTPETFNQELLQASMTRKKARKVFAA